MELDLHSNDSLDRQVDIYINEGRFHASLLSLLVLVTWIVYVVFYNSRFLGVLTSFFLRNFVKNGYIRIGSISLSMVSGKIMLRDLVYLTNDFSLRCGYAVFVFNYWKPYDPELQDPSCRRLFVHFYGFELHVFNRTAEYELLKQQFNLKNLKSDSSTDVSLSAAGAPTTRQSYPSNSGFGEVESFLGWMWSRLENLLPIVKFTLETSKICLGNQLMPRALVLTCQKAHGILRKEKTTYRFAKYLHSIRVEFSNLLCTLVSVSKYSGHYAVEEPPIGGDRFRLLNLGKGVIVYKQDEPDPLLLQPGLEIFANCDNLAPCQWPTWDLTVSASEDFHLGYGPWADRQRMILWQFYFPASYRPMHVPKSDELTPYQATQRFQLKVESQTNVKLDLCFSSSQQSKQFSVIGGPKSQLEITVPWVNDANGYTTSFNLLLTDGCLITDCLWHDLLLTSKLELKLCIHYPTDWNRLQTWDFDVSGKEVKLCLLYTQKDYFKGFFDDWSSGSRPDILFFVPYVYNFNVNASPFEFRTLANDFNWVTPTAENAFISFCLKTCSFKFSLPFSDFLPQAVPIEFVIKGYHAVCCLSLPETSTMLYVLKELHSNLRLADGNCKPRNSNPFRIIEETLKPVKEGVPARTRYWVECWRAPMANLSISYTYHPIPWVPDYWRFLPNEWSPGSWSPAPVGGSLGSPTSKSSLAFFDATGTEHKGSARLPKESLPRSHIADAEEAALGGLRPEGSRAHGPTESVLVNADFNPAYMMPDIVSVHLSVPKSQLVFYGALVRQFVHVKEAYLGCFQTPATTATLAEDGQPAQAAKEKANIQKTAEVIVDPRECRPFSVRVTLAIHNLQAHLPIHSNSSGPLCPTAFLDCIGFELDKNFYETKLQLLFSPILLCVFDQCQPFRPLSSAGLGTGRLQLAGLEMRGHAMFSNRGLPLKSETVEYAWLLEITCGTISGQITTPQLSSLVHCISNFVFSVLDSENALLSRCSGELCQHALPPEKCCKWLCKSPGAELCPTELALKYRLFRFNLDGVELAVVEAGTCLVLMLDAVRVARCNLHDVHSRDGISVFLPRVQFLQLIKPIDKSVNYNRIKLGTSKFTAPKHFARRVEPLLEQSVKSSRASTSLRAYRSPWLEAGSLGFGPVHLQSGISGLDHAYRDSQLSFIRQHDELTRRLWFFWMDWQHNQPSNPGQYVQPLSNPVHCGCYGNCAFFGPNFNGKRLFDEVATGTFSRRAVFVPPGVESVPPIPKSACFQSTLSLTDVTVESTSRSLGVRFGESLLFPDRLLFQLHDPSICTEETNGYGVMRLDVVRADEAAKFEMVIDEKGTTGCHCYSDSELSFEENEEIVGDVDDRYPRVPSNTRISSDSEFNSASLNADAEEETEIELLRIKRKVGGNKLDGISLTSFIESLSSTSPAAYSSRSGSPSGRSPPTPPPRQGPTLTRVSACSVPLNEDRLTSAGLLRRAESTTSSQQPTMRPPNLPPQSLASDQSQLRPLMRRDPTSDADRSSASDVDDVLAKYVDLQGQLNRPITESSLLGSAYSRHLNCYITTNGAPLCPRLRLRRRWHACSLLNDVAKPNRNSADGDLITDAESRRASCRIGIARAPEFFCSTAGFSFCSMVDKTQSKSKGPVNFKDASDSSTSQSHFVVADLRPLLYPHCRTRRCEATGVESHSTTLVSRSSTTVSVLGPVDIFLTPLFIECLDRYVCIMAPVMLELPVATVIDELHFKCLRSASQRGKVVYEQHLQSDPQKQPSLSARNSPSFLLPPISVKQRQLESAGTPPSSQLPKKSDAVPLRTVMTARGSKLSVCGKLIEENNLIGRLSLDRVNIGFMQIYAIEDLVTLDSITSGLHDLTCVSLLALAVDSVKVEVLKNDRAVHYGVEGALATAVFSEPLSGVGGGEQSGDANNTKLTLIDNAVPLRASRSPFTIDEKFDDASNDIDDDGEEPDLVTTLTAPEFTAASPLLMHAPSISRSASAHQAVPINTSPFSGKYKRVAPTDNGPHFIGRNEDTSVLSNSLLRSPSMVASDLTPATTKIVSTDEVHHTSRLVCNFSINRIHSQLRRLTRESHFTPDVLLTAIPFSGSRVFFGFDSDSLASVAMSNAGCPQQRPSSSNPGSSNLYTGVHGTSQTVPFPSTPMPAPFLTGHSSGWIMFECGMEQLTLLFVQRKGFGDSIEEYKSSEDGHNGQVCVVNKGCKVSQYTEQLHETQTRVDAENGNDEAQTDELSAVEMGLIGSDSQKDISTAHIESTTKRKGVSDRSLKEETVEKVGGSETARNAFQMHLHVKTVWLNFPAPKHLPNKRRVEIIRSDWNFLSTVTPTVNAWMGPCNRLVASSKHLHSISERRHLSALACLMMESIQSEISLPDFRIRLRFSSLEGDFNAYSTWRTPEAQVLRYDPSCQIFTVLRRYLQSLRKNRGPDFVNNAFLEWLRGEVVPENMLLFRGVLLMLRQWSYSVDIFLPARLPAQTLGKKSLFQRIAQQQQQKRANDGNTIAVGPADRWWGQDGFGDQGRSVKMFAGSTWGVKADTAEIVPATADKINSLSASCLGAKGTVESGHTPSGLALRMFELMITDSDREPMKKSTPLVDQFCQSWDSSPPQNFPVLDSSLDENPVGCRKTSLDDSILTRFLHDSQRGVGVSDQAFGDADRIRSSPRRVFSGVYPKGDGPVNTGDGGCRVQHTDTVGKYNDAQVDYLSEPVLSAEDLSQVNHINGQFRFVEDAQRLFRPLLEAIGVNVKGVRRSTLMKKFGGLFAAEGMLDAFQIEICESLDNPLQKQNETGNGIAVDATVATFDRRVRHPKTGTRFFTSPLRRVFSVSPSSARFGEGSPSSQLALLCHRFSTKLTFRDMVGFSQDGEKFISSQTGDAEVRLTTTQVTALLQLEGVSQHSNLPLLRLMHQFVTMVYLAKDAQHSMEESYAVTHYRRNPTQLIVEEPSDGTATSTMKTGSVGYARLSGETQTSTPDNAAAFPRPSSSDNVPENILPRASSSSLMAVSGVPLTGRSNGHADPVGDVGGNNGSGDLDEPMSMSHLPAEAPSVVTSTTTPLPACWRRMLSHIEVCSTVPEPKNVVKKPPLVLPTISEERAFYNRRKGVGLKKSDQTQQTSASARFGFSHFRGVIDEDVEAGQLLANTSTAPMTVSAAHFEEPELDKGAPTFVPPAPSSVASSRDSRTPSGPQVASNASFQQRVTAVPWLRTRRVPMVVFVTVKVREMNVSAVLNELNLTATVRDIHGSFTQTNKIRGHSRFKEKSSIYSLSGHCGHSDIRLVEDFEGRCLEAACMKTGPSHVLLSCSRSRRSEKNALVIGVGHVAVTLPHHPVCLHSIMQRHTRHFSTVQDYLQFPSAPAPQFRKRSHTNLPRETRMYKRINADLHSKDLVSPSMPPLVVNVSAVAGGLKVNVALHPCLNAVYHVDPIYFIGQIGPSGFVDIKLTKHSLSFQSQQLPISFPRAVSINFPEIAISVSRRYSPTAAGDAYLYIQSNIGSFDQALPSDMLNYIMVVVKLFMKEINEVIRKMAGEQQSWSSATGISQDQFQKPQVGASQTSFSADVAFQEPVASNRFAVATRFICHLKLGGIRLTATTVAGAVKLETNEIHVDLSNRIGRSHASWYTESSSSSVAPLRGHVTAVAAVSSVSESASPRLPPSAPLRHAPPKPLHSQPHRSAGPRDPQARLAIADVKPLTGSESILLHAKMDRFCIELGQLDQDLLYNERIPEFRTLAFFKTSVSLRSLLADDVPTQQPYVLLQRAVTDEVSLPPTVAGGVGTINHSRVVPSQGVNYSTATLSSLLGSTPLLDDSLTGLAPPPLRSTTRTTSSSEHEAFLVTLRRPILWAKPSAFDRGILIWMMYTREFSKWNEQIRKLDALSGHANVLGSVLRRKTNTVSHRLRDHRAGPPPAPPTTPVAFSVVGSSTTTPDTASSGGGKRAVSGAMSRDFPLLARGPTLFFQLNVEDLGICLPTNILQVPLQSMEVDSRTALVLTLDRSRVSACLHSSLVSEGEFTDFCLRFDDDFNVGSDDWKPDRPKSTIIVKGEEHKVVMNACVVPSGTFGVCWRALENLRPEERARWLVNIQWKMCGLDVHMDDNIGRRLRSLIITLTTMAGYDGRRGSPRAGPAVPATSTTEEEQEEPKDKQQVQQVVMAGSGAIASQSQRLPVRRARDVRRHFYQSTNFDVASVDRLYMGEQHHLGGPNTPESLLDIDSQKHILFQQLKKKTSALVGPSSSGRLQRCGSVMSNLRKRSKIDRLHANAPVGFPASSSQLISSAVSGLPPSTVHSYRSVGAATTSESSTIYDEIDDPNTFVANLSHAGSVYYDVEDVDYWRTLDDVTVYSTQAKRLSHSEGNGPDEEVDDDLYALNSEYDDHFGELRTLDGFTLSQDDITMPAPSPPPLPPPRKSAVWQLDTQLQPPANTEEPENAANEGEVKSSLLFELDVHLHVDSGRCVLHPRLSSNAAAMMGGSASAAGKMVSLRQQNILAPRIDNMPAGKQLFQPSPSVSIGAPQEDLLSAYLIRYKRQLCQDALQKPTNVSVFYIPAVDVGLHYTSHTKYGLSESRGLRQFRESVPQCHVPTNVDDVFSSPMAEHVDCGALQHSSTTAPDCVPSAGLQSSRSHVSQLGSTGAAAVAHSNDVGKSADLYATCVLQKLPKELIVHTGLLDFLEQALENLPLVADGDSDSLTGSEEGPLNGILLSSSKTLLVDVVVHLHVQPSTIYFLCLPVSQIRCLFTLPSLDVVFSTERQAPENLRVSANADLPDEADSQLVQATRQRTSGRFTTITIGDKVIQGDLVSDGGLCVTAILTEFQMVVFHPYGGGDSALSREEKNWLSTSSANSLTLKVRDIRLNISRIVQTSLVPPQSSLSGIIVSNATVAEVPDSSGAASTSLRTTMSGSHVAMASGTSGEGASLHNVVRFSGVFDIGVAEFKCDTRRTREILDIPNVWYRSKLARALFIGQDTAINCAEGPVSFPRLNDSSSDSSDDVDKISRSDDVASILEKEPSLTRDPIAEKTQRQICPPLVANPIASWLQRGPAVSVTSRVTAGTAAAPLSVVLQPDAANQQNSAENYLVTKPSCRSATAPRDIGALGHHTLASGVLSNATTLPCGGTPCVGGTGSRGGSLGVSSWQALPIFYANISHLNLEMYIGSAMGLTRLNARDLFCDGRLYQDSSRCRQGSLGAGLRSCQFTSEKGVVGGEFSLIDLESRIHVKEDPRFDPRHSAEILVGGLQARMEYMNANIIFLRLSRLETYLHDEWCLREAEQLRMATNSVPNNSQPRSQTFVGSDPDEPTRRRASPDRCWSLSSSSAAPATSQPPQTSVVIGPPPVYVMVGGEISWDQLQLAIARTTTVDLIRSARKVREYFEEQLREGRLTLTGQGDYFLRPDSSTVAESISLQTAESSGETFTSTTMRCGHYTTVDSQMGMIPASSVDRLLQRHWQTPMLEAIQVCLRHVAGIGPHAELVRRDILTASSSRPTQPTFFDASSIPPVLGGSLQLSGRSLALACFAGNFRSAPDWAVFNLQHPTICFETEAQREPEARPRGPTQPQASRTAAADLFGLDEDIAMTLVSTPTSSEEVGGWLNVRQVLSFDLGQQPQYRPQTAYVLRIRRGREQNPVKLPIVATISEWMEFMFKAVDNTVLSHVRGYNAQQPADIVKLTEFAVQFPLPTLLPARLSRDKYPKTLLTEPIPSVEQPSSKKGVLNSAISGFHHRINSDTMSNEAALGNGPASMRTPPRMNPLKPPVDAEILFVLPSISMRLTTDQRQPMARPSGEHLVKMAQDVQNSNRAVTLEMAASAVTNLKSAANESVEKRDRATPHCNSKVGYKSEAKEAVFTEYQKAKVNLSFQTDFHGVIQLGLIDVPWLPSLIHSYISEQQHEFESMSTPDPAYAVTSRTLQLAKDGRLGTVSANTSSPIVQDMRTYDVIHWSLSPECRWLLATNIAVPAFDKLLENIGFHRARVTIPKWLQRGALDHLDAVVAGLLRTSLRLSTDDISDSNHRHQGRQQVIIDEDRNLCVNSDITSGELPVSEGPSRSGSRLPPTTLALVGRPKSDKKTASDRDNAELEEGVR